MPAVPADPGAGAGSVAGGEVAAGGVAAGDWVAAGAGLAVAAGAWDAGGDCAGAADPDAPGLTRKMPSPARPRTTRTKTAFRWPGVASMAAPATSDGGSAGA